jgi:uncharacterized damage-inducible protein DinB
MMRTLMKLMTGVAAVGMLMAGAAASAQMPKTPRPVVDGIQFLYSGIERNVMGTAELSTDALLAYRPSPDVRAFGEVLGHIADSQNAICAGARGGNVNLKDTVEKGVTSKAGLIAELRKSFETCRAVYATMSDADVAKMVPFGQGETAVATMLSFNVSHTNEHYGNLVTYMRMNGVVPPSSRAGDGR